jgi:hypothetical protein
MVLSKKDRKLKDRKLKEGIASLDRTVSTLKNIKGFISLPPDGLKLYVKYRGDISPGQGSEETPLGEEPKNIQGRILDARNYPADTDNHFFRIILIVTKSPDPNDIGKKISIYPTRDHISLYPFESLIGSMKKKFKGIFKRREPDNYGGAKKKKSKKKFKKRNYKKLKKRKTKKKMKFRKKTKKKKRKSKRKK